MFCLTNALKPFISFKPALWSSNFSYIVVNLSCSNLNCFTVPSYLFIKLLDISMLAVIITLALNFRHNSSAGAPISDSWLNLFSCFCYICIRTMFGIWSSACIEIKELERLSWNVWLWTLFGLISELQWDRMDYF